MRKIIGFAFALLVISGLSFSVNNVTDCMDISSNADPEYQLLNSLSGANQTTFVCIRILVSDIVLDCNGFSITDNGTASSIGIYTDTVSNVTIQNCPSISNYSTGVRLFDTNDSLVSNVTAHNNTDGFILYSGTGNTISDSTARDNGDRGFALEAGFSGNLLSNNVAHDNTFRGFTALLNSNNTFDGSTAFNNPTDGFFLNAVTDSELTDNTAYANGNGIRSISGSGIIVDNNTAYNNSAGIYVLSSNDTTLVENNAYNNSGNGYYLDTVRDSTVDSNTAAGNGDDGFTMIASLFLSPGNNVLSNNIATDNGDSTFDSGFDLSFSDGNVLSGNTATDNFGDGFVLALCSNNTLSGNVVSGGARGIRFFSGGANNTVIGNNVSGATSSAIFTGDNNIFTDNIVSNSFQGVSLGSNNVLTGNLVYGIAAFGAFRMESASHNNVFTDNTAHSSNRGLEILGANNTTVTNMHMYNNSFVDFLTSADSGGDRFSTLSGLVFDRPAGDFTDYTNLSITDNLENGSVYSIEYTANPGSSPTANHISFANKFVSIVNSTPGLSIDSIIWHWDDSELTSYNENNFELWKLDGSIWTLMNDTSDTGANTLSLSDLSSFSTFGIFDSASNVTDCMNITTSGNYVLATDLFGASINGSPLFTGLACIRISASNVLLDCNGFSITDNVSGVTGGIVTEGPGAAAISGVTVQNCAVSSYSQGIVVINTDDSSFINNTVFGNGFTGISARDGSTGNTYSSNTVFGNSEHGFELSDNADGNTLSGNTAFNNGINGFHLEPGSNNTIDNNTASGNAAHGFVLSGSSDGNILSGNLAFNNTGGEGFYVAFGPSGNQLTGNTAYGNGDSGFGVSSSTDNLLSGNTAHDNTFGGFFLVFGADDNDLVDNTAYGHPNGLFVADSNNTFVDGMHLYDNGDDFQVSGSGIAIDLYGVVFDDPAGNFTNFTNLTLGDLVDSEYSIDHATQPASLPVGRTSFANKFVDITPISGNVSIDLINWLWLDSELTNTSNESRFELWKYNGTWSKQNATLDTVTNELSLSPVNSFSTFAILQNGSAVPPGGDGDGDDGGADEDPLSASLNSTVDGNIVTVTSDGSPVPGANVLVDGLSVGLTNASGQVEFPGCSDTVVIKAKKDGYQDAEMTATLADCPACTTNADCPVTAQCTENQCVPVPCACGSVQDHQCVAYQCCSDADCPATQMCSGNACVPKAVHECTQDSDCGDTQYCDIPPTVSGGTCREIVGCGTVSGHQLTPYECGSGPNCPTCPSGEMCEANKCVAYAIQCPASGFLGDEITCKLLKDGAPCASCAGTLTEPDGTTRPFTTNAAGEFTFSLDKQGEYKVAVLSDGTTVRSIAVSSLPKTPGTGGETPTGTGGGGDLLLPILLVLALIIVGGVLYWRSRKK